MNEAIIKPLKFKRIRKGLYQAGGFFSKKYIAEKNGNAWTARTMSSNTELEATEYKTYRDAKGFLNFKYKEDYRLYVDMFTISPFSDFKFKDFIELGESASKFEHIILYERKV